MNLSAATGLAAALLAWPALAPAPTAPHVVVGPNWLRKPTAEELAFAWPASATQQQIGSGSAMISCVVAETGALEQCRVTQESPQGAGFGAAALTLAPLMLMKPKTIDGASVGGAVVTIPIHFMNPSIKSPDGSIQQTVVAPDWLRKPTEDETAAYWPSAATRLHVDDGRAQIVCGVTKLGLMVGCQVTDEEPKGMDFGQAALALAPLMLMKSQTMEGKPTGLGSVSVPISFHYPEEDEDKDAEREAGPDVGALGGAPTLFKPPPGNAPHNDDAAPQAKPLPRLNVLWTKAPTSAEVAALFPKAAIGKSGPRCWNRVRQLSGRRGRQACRLPGGEGGSPEPRLRRGGRRAAPDPSGEPLERRGSAGGRPAHDPAGAAHDRPAQRRQVARPGLDLDHAPAIIRRNGERP